MDTPHNQIDPFCLETQLKHNPHQKFPHHSIVCFQHIEFDCHRPKPASITLHMVKTLTCHQYIICDQAPWSKGALSIGDNPLQ